jgi:hypothetical protein
MFSLASVRGRLQVFISAVGPVRARAKGARVASLQEQLSQPAVALSVVTAQRTLDEHLRRANSQNVPPSPNFQPRRQEIYFTIEVIEITGEIDNFLQNLGGSTNYFRLY